MPEETKQEDKPEFEKKLEEMKAENTRMEKNIAELKQLKAMEALGGGTNTGQTQEKPREMTPVEYKNAVEKGLIKK